MEFDIIQRSVPSSDGIHSLYGRLFVPKGSIKGFFHIVHGMTEYIDRYEKFMSDMACDGWLCFGYDNLGHGRTVSDDSELGFIAHKDGYDLLCRDVKVFSDLVISEYTKNGEKLPYILMGHSMGSFIVRLAAERYVTPDKLIIMGTSGPNGAADAGLALISVIKRLKGERHFSPLIDGIAFGSYDKRFEDASGDVGGAWLTTDKEVRRKYAADKYCTFKFSVSAMGDLIRLIKYCNRKEWYKRLPKTLDILLVSGAEDPVGDFSRGVITVHQRLLAQGITATLKLYPDARHEILNDFSRENVIKDIIEFIK